MPARNCLTIAAVVLATQRPAASATDAQAIRANYRKFGVRIPMRVHHSALRPSRIEVSVLP